MNVVNGNGFEKINRYPVRLVFAKTSFVICKPMEFKPDENVMTVTMREYLDRALGKETVDTINIQVSKDIPAILLAAGMHCLGCPASQEETLEEACMVHGIDVEESMPFLFYYLHFSYMDNFLYVCFVEQ